MIARLTGRPSQRDEQALVLDVGGVGYLVNGTRSALRKARKADEVTLETYLHVREDALQLYGFAEVEELELFEHLLSVSGVGPKVALAIVSGSTPSELRHAIAVDDTARFQAIPGIGKKTAQRVVLELKEKLGADGVEIPAPAGKEDALAREALLELGYSISEAEKALSDTDPDLPAEERVRQALKAA
jgi:Holliday junction DNA helicase RuvA